MSRILFHEKGKKKTKELRDRKEAAWEKSMLFAMACSIESCIIVMVIQKFVSGE